MSAVLSMPAAKSCSKIEPDSSADVPALSRPFATYSSVSGRLARLLGWWWSVISLGSENRAAQCQMSSRLGAAAIEPGRIQECQGQKPVFGRGIFVNPGCNSHISCPQVNTFAK